MPAPKINALPIVLTFALIPFFLVGQPISGNREPLPRAPYVQLRDGLPHSYQRITRDKKATVAFLGGSITHNPGWRDKVSRYLSEQFPETKFDFIAAGIPSLGSLPHAFRFRQDVLEKGKPDLLFVEAAVNDRGNATDSLTQLRALEGIVRQARKNNPAMDIVLMAFVDPHKLADFRKGKIPTEVANHERIADYYRLPSINLAREVYDRIEAGEFSWEKDFKDLHPSPFGQELYFQTIKYLIDRSFSEKNITSTQKPSLPRPLQAARLENGRYVPVRAATLKSGWNLVENWKPTDSLPTRAGFVNRPMLEALRPNAELTLAFTGTAVGIAVISGPDAGEVEYSIDGGPGRRVDLYTQWSNQLHLPWYKLFEAGLPDKKHLLTLRISESRNPKSKGTACRIVYFLVNE